MKWLINLFCLLFSISAFSQIPLAPTIQLSSNSVISWSSPKQYVDGTLVVSTTPIFYGISLQNSGNTIVSIPNYPYNTIRLGDIYGGFQVGQTYVFILKSIINGTASTNITENIVYSLNPVNPLPPAFTNSPGSSIFVFTNSNVTIMVNQ